jgi:transcriptional regulator with XRE-family HTH domain
MTKAAELLETTMIERQLTGYQLAKKTGVSQSCISRMRRGLYKPTYRVAVILARELNIDHDALLADSVPSIG